EPATSRRRRSGARWPGEHHVNVDGALRGQSVVRYPERRMPECWGSPGDPIATSLELSRSRAEGSGAPIRPNRRRLNVEAENGLEVLLVHRRAALRRRDGAVELDRDPALPAGIMEDLQNAGEIYAAASQLEELTVSIEDRGGVVVRVNSWIL